MKKYLLSLILIGAMAFNAVASSSDNILLSPSGDVKFAFTQPSIRGGGTELTYSVSYKGKKVVSESRLGLDVECDALQSTPNSQGEAAPYWGSQLSLVERTKESVSDDWTPLYGERSTIKNRYNQMVFKFTDKNGKNSFNILVRAYDEGVAFRYVFTDAIEGREINIKREYTSFTLPKGTMAYHTGTAQGYYTVRPLEDWGGREAAERPLTLKLPDGTYVALCEAEMIDYARGKFRLANPYVLEVSMDGNAEVVAPYNTPWRLIMVADNAVDLINNNDITLNLNEPSKIEDTSWIKPGKAFRSGLDMATAKRSVDFVVSQNYQYVHLDAGWYGPEHDMASDATTTEDRFNLDMKELCDYAASKGVGVFLYVNHRALERQLDEILPLYKEWGVKGIKFGFVNVGSQEWTTWLYDSVRKCAEYGIMVDVHDEHRPTGYSRTYPHFMNQEGIGGNEVMPGATHNTILPFTRMVCGAADYTFCYFSSRVKNTKAHQLALPVIFYSPLQFMHWYDGPDTYQGEEELEFWQKMPVDWNDSRTIDGQIGEYIIQARRSGDEWFVGAITNTSEREITIDCSKFLDSGASYDVSIYEDDETLNTRTNVKITRRGVKSTDLLNFSLEASGGVSLHFTKR